MRRRGRTDANHTEVRDELRARYFHVTDLSGAGDGVPDLLVAWPGAATLVEVKDGAKCPSARRLTKDQVEFHRRYPGPLVIVESVDQAVEVLERMRKGAR